MDFISQPQVRHILVCILVVSTFGAFAFFAYRPRVADYGWQMIQPGPMHWAMLPLCVSLSAFLIAMVVHSGAPPLYGDFLFFYAVLAFALGSSIWFPFYIRGIKHSNIHWRDQWLAYNHLKCRRVQDMRDIVEFYERWDKCFVMTFADGTQLKVDPYCRGAERLFETIHRYAGADPTAELSIGDRP